MGGVAGEEHVPGAEAIGQLGDERERTAALDGDGEAGHSGRGAHTGPDPVRGIAGERRRRGPSRRRRAVHRVPGLRLRAGLFDAVVDDVWARSGVADLTEAVAHEDAREHLRGGIRAANAMYAAERDVYRVLFSMAQLQPDTIGAAVARKERNRSGGMKHLAKRLADQGLLRPGLTVAAAADALWVLCSFEAFDLLFTGRKMSLAATNARLISDAEHALYRDPPAGDAPAPRRRARAGA